MKLILSTLSAPAKLVFTVKQSNGKLSVGKTILIKGGANVIDRKTLATPLGVVTELNDKDYELVINSDWYKRQNKAGFVRPVEKKDDADEPTKKGMNSKDNSAQKTEADYKDKKIKPKSNKEADED